MRQDTCRRPGLRHACAPTRVRRPWNWRVDMMKCARSPTTLARRDLEPSGQGSLKARPPPTLRPPPGTVRGRKSRRLPRKVSCSRTDQAGTAAPSTPPTPAAGSGSGATRRGLAEERGSPTRPEPPPPQPSPFPSATASTARVRVAIAPEDARRDPAGFRHARAQAVRRGDHCLRRLGRQALCCPPRASLARHEVLHLCEGGGPS